MRTLNIKDATMHMKLETEVQSLKDKVDDYRTGTGVTTSTYAASPRTLKAAMQRDFLSESYQKFLGIKNFPTPITCKRAHHLGKPSAGRGDTPRPRHMIAKLLNFKNKEKIMRLNSVKH